MKRRETTERMRIVFLLHNAYAIGGTVRTTLNLAAALAGRHDVEIVSMRRHRDEPRFTVDPRITHRPAGGRAGRQPGPHGPVLRPAGRRLPRLRQALRAVHAGSPTCAPATIWRRCDADVVIGTRPGINVYVARFAPRRALRIAQEHLRHDSHSKRLRGVLARAYRSLDAVVTTTEADAEVYRQRMPLPGVRVAAVPNMVPAPHGLTRDGTDEGDHRGRPPGPRQTLRPADRGLLRGRLEGTRLAAADLRRRSRAGTPPAPDRRPGPGRARPPHGTAYADRGGVRQVGDGGLGLGRGVVRDDPGRGDALRGAGDQHGLPARPRRDHHGRRRRPARPRGRRPLPRRGDARPDHGRAPAAGDGRGGPAKLPPLRRRPDRRPLRGPVHRTQGNPHPPRLDPGPGPRRGLGPPPVPPLPPPDERPDPQPSTARDPQDRDARVLRGRHTQYAGRPTWVPSPPGPPGSRTGPPGFPGRCDEPPAFARRAARRGSRDICGSC